LEAIARERERGRIDLCVYREGEEREISQGKRGLLIEEDEMDILVIWKIVIIKVINMILLFLLVICGYVLRRAHRKGNNIFIYFVGFDN
jgi:hypothetical protein